ncbi:MAG: thioredoxin family protein [bacterium]
MRLRLLSGILLLVIVVAFIFILSGKKEKRSVNVPETTVNAPVGNMPPTKVEAKGNKTEKMEGDVVRLNAKNFSQFISSDMPTVVDFWRTGCGACMMLEPVFKELAGEMKGKMRFAMLQLDEEGNEQFLNKFGIIGTPTMIVFKKGKEIGRIVGYSGKESVRNSLENILKVNK